MTRINKSDSERTILITAYKYLNDDKTTTLIDSQGNSIEMSDFELGQRVEVNGLELSGGMIVGDQIQIKPRR